MNKFKNSDKKILDDVSVQIWNELILYMVIIMNQHSYRRMIILYNN